MVTAAGAAEKPVPAAVVEREAGQARLLAGRAAAHAPAPQAFAGQPGADSPLAALLSKLDALADRPVAVDVVVVSKIDGRAVAQAVYKDVRQQKVKSYGTL